MPYDALFSLGNMLMPTSLLAPSAATSEIRVLWVNSGAHSSLAHAALVVVSAPSSRQVRPEAFSITFCAKASSLSAAFISKDMAVQGSEERPGSRRSIVPDGQVAWSQCWTPAGTSLGLLISDHTATRFELQVQS